MTPPRRDRCHMSDTTPPTADADAYEALVREHYERLCNFAFRLLSSREAAEDIVHDVFLQIWRHREQFEFHDPLAYLYRAVRNRAAGLHRHEAMRARVLTGLTPEAGANEPAAASDSAAEQEAHDLAAAVARAVDTLPPRCRLIFTMSREQGLTYAEIAAALELSVKTVEAQMSRAFKLLRPQLVRYLTAIALASTAI